MPHFPKPWFWKERRAWFVTISGKRHALGPDETAAHRLYHQLMSQHAPGVKLVGGDVAADSTSPRLIDLFDRYLKFLNTNRAPRTFEFNKAAIQSFVDSLDDENMTIARLKPVHVQNWIDSKLPVRPITSCGPW